MARILVVDDEDIIRFLVGARLKLDLHEVMEATNGAEAFKELELALLCGESFDLVISDIGMPAVNGIELTRAIRSHADRKINTMPVILMTAGNIARWRPAALEVGAHALLSKPFDKNELLRAVCEVLGVSARGTP